MRIFGVKIDQYKADLIKKECVQKLKNPVDKPFFIVTLNPEILLTARKDNRYKKIINSAGLRIIDGFGIRLIGWLKKKSVSTIITGAELAQFLIAETNKLNLKIGIIFLKEGWSSQEEIQKSLVIIKNIKLIKISKKEKLNFDFKKLNNCQLILVATGHPHQEQLIYKYLSKKGKTRIIMGIGGTLDFWTKKKIRAPKLIQNLGLEWFWRLMIQPNRLPRIFQAVVKFPILALLESISKNK